MVQIHVGYRLIDQIKDFLVPGSLGIVMAVGVYSAGTLFTGKLITLLVQTVFGAFIYITLSHVLKIEEYNYLRNIIIRRKS